MRDAFLDLGTLVLVWVGIWAVFGAALGGRDPAEWPTVRAVRWLAGRLRRPPAPEVVPLHRPIEQVGPDARRLHEAFHRGGMRFAKYEGCRLAYDSVLAEAAEILEIDHLLAVLPPGDERDRERERVEVLLEHRGMLR